MTPATQRLLARSGLLLLMVGSAVACLLVEIPFTYQAVLRAGLLPWLPRALALQPWLLLALVLVNLWVDRESFATHLLGRIRTPLLAATGLAALASGLLPWLQGMEPGPFTRLACLSFLTLPLALLSLDLLEARPLWPERNPKADDARRLFTSVLLTALLSATLFFAIGLYRIRGSASVLTSPELATTFAWSLLGHGLLWAMAGVALLGLQSFAGFFPRLRRAEFLITLAALAAAVAGTLLGVVFPGIAFAGPFAWVIATLVGLGLALFLALAGLALAPQGQPVGSALEVLFRPLHPVRSTPLSLGFALLLAAGIACLLGLQVSRFDWNFLAQQLGALLVAVLIFTPIYLSQSHRAERHSWSPRLFLAPLLALALFRLWATPVQHPARGWLLRPGTRAVATFTGFDPSARLAGALLRPAAPALAAIYGLLLANSNIPHTVRVEAKDLNLVTPLLPGTGEKPDIYIFVMDSLRQDYLGAYNKRVTFTPNLDRFAAESTVIPRAFTRYGATGLSEPSIWVGGMILHKQYIIPFHPLNTLQKLVEVDGYRPYLSMDSILDVVWKPNPAMVRLDAGRGTSDLRLGTTLQELARTLEQAPAGQPVFVYSQAQDLHISTINREGKDVPGGGDYPGFYAPYASRVRRFDAQFGAFIQYLKDRGRYDRSLIIFTADHGDSLGEEGRFGHAYTLFPEIMRVPLILHVPEKLRAGLQLDPRQAAFLTDLTPTLYYLLGHRPLAADPVLGRPLFTQTQAERDRYRREYHLLASSYGAVWGLLSGDGSTLYISDGVNFTDHLFELGGPGLSTQKAVTPDLKGRYDQLIVGELQHLNAFYAFSPRTPSR